MERIEFGEFRTNDVMRKHIQECLDNNWITMGPKVELFEKKFGEKLEYDCVVATSSGTTADITACLSLYELGAKEGDEVICPALGFIAYANAIKAARLEPCFVDVKKETLNIDENLVEQKIGPKTRAIIAVNTMGKPCNLTRLREICDKHRLILIVDNCEGHLCKHNNKYSGYYGDIVTYSAYTAHLIMAGEQGLICTNRRPELDSIFRSIRSHGRVGNSLAFDHVRIGYNHKPTDLHASVGLGEVDEIYETFNTRKNNWNYLMDKCSFLRDVGYLSEEDENDVNCPHGFSFVSSVGNFDLLTSTLDKYNIHWKYNFKCIPNQHAAYKQYRGYYPNSDFIGLNGLHIGVHKYLTRNDLDRIVIAFQEFKDQV